MRFCLLVLALVAAATAIPELQKEAGKVDFLKKQRDVNLLLLQPLQEIPDEELRNIGRTYEIEKYLDKYDDVAAVKYLYRSVSLGLVAPKAVPATTVRTELRKEYTVVLRTLIGAKDYETFRYTAAWLRTRFNIELFVAAFSTAVLHRPDTKGVLLPPLYEVFPNYFFDSRLIQEAQNIRSIGYDTMRGKTVVLPCNYTAKMILGERNIDYFTQDIGLSSYYAFFGLTGLLGDFDFETELKRNTDTDKYVIGRGSQYWYVHKQLMARYHMERLSNNLSPIKDLDTTHIRMPFKSNLRYINGLNMVERPADYFPEKEDKHLVKLMWDLERRIVDTIDLGFAMTAKGNLLALYEDTKGLDILGNIIEGFGRSINPRYYGSFQAIAKRVLGGCITCQDVVDYRPTALELFGTATRDPIFWELYNHITSLFRRYQNALPAYKREDLYLDGVKIDSVTFDKLVTYFDEFEVDLDAATYKNLGQNKQDDVEIKTVIDRLNHKPFNYKIVVKSDKPIDKAVVRVFMGPKYDYNGHIVNIRENRKMFFELDQFLWNIKNGETIIERNNKQAPMRSFEQTPIKEIRRKVEGAMDSHTPFYHTQVMEMFGFPERLALPRGRPEGLELQVVVVITPPKTKTVSFTPVVPDIFKSFMKRDYDIIDYDVPTLKEVGSGTFWSTNRRNYVEDVDTGILGDRFLRANVRRQRSIDDVSSGLNVDYLKDYYKDKTITELIGGAITLDGRPLGFPLERPLALGCLDVPNIKAIDVKVYHEGKLNLYKIEDFKTMNY